MATTLEELSVKLQADNKEFIQQMLAAQKATQSAMEKMADSVNKMTDKKKDVSGFQKVMEVFAGNVLANIATKAFEVAADAAKMFFDVMVIQGIDAAAEAEESVSRLNFALAQAGEYSKKTSSEFQEWAAALQSTTKYSDDAILKNAALIESMAKLDSAGLKKATEAAMNLSSALGIDLETATRMVGKAATGEVSSFSKYGLKIDETADKALNYANALKAIQGLGPAAAQESNTFSGAVKILSNSFNDVQESIGNVIVQNPVVVATMKALGEAFGELSKWISANSQGIREFVGKGIVIAIDVVSGFTMVLDTLMRVGVAAFNGVEAAVYGFGSAMGVVLNAVGLMSDKTFAELSNAAETSLKKATDAVEGEGLLGGMIGKLGEIKGAADEAFKATEKGAIASVEPVNNLKGKTAELSLAMETLIKQGKDLAESYMKATVDSKAMAEQQLKNAEIARDMAMEKAKAEETANVFALDSVKKRHDAEIEAQKAFFDAKNANLAAQQQAELDAVTAANENGKLSEEQYQIALKGIRDKYDLEGRKAKVERQKFDNTLKEAELKAVKDQFSSLSSLQDSQNSYAKSVGKAAAIANTIINTQTAAQGAYAALSPIPFVGPALGAAAAAAVIADGATRLGIIRGAKTGISEVPGIGTNDSYGPVALAPGERVVPGETNDDLKKAIGMILSGQGGGSERVIVEIRLTDGAYEMIEAKLIERQRISVASS